MKLNSGTKGMLADPKFTKLLISILLAVLSYLGYENREIVTGPPKFALPPEAKIKGPTAGRPGSLLILDATESTGKFFAWSVSPQLPDGETTIYPIENNTKCLLTSIPGTYTVFLAVGNEEGISMVNWTVKVRAGPDPTPDPPKPDPPKPDPEPDPPEPDLTGIAKEAYEHYQDVDAKAGETEALIIALKLTATQAAALNQNVEQINASLLSNTKAIFGGEKEIAERWKPFRPWLAETLKTNAGDAKQLIETLQQIAEGLEVANG